MKNIPILGSIYIQLKGIKENLVKNSPYSKTDPVN